LLDPETNEVLAGRLEATESTVKWRFAHARENFHEVFTYIRSALDSVSIRPGIRRIVALACGTMTRTDHSYRCSMVQHALALALREYLASRQETGDQSNNPTGGIECFAQDPAYTTLDKRILKEAGFAVVDDPGAFLEVHERSVVISVNSNIPVRQIVADLPRPSMVIWDRVVDRDLSHTGA
jgi:hypothetical protein